jgi:hypothetical protein
MQTSYIVWVSHMTTQILVQITYHQAVGVFGAVWGLLAIGRTIGLLLVGATDSSATAWRLKASRIPRSVQ